MENTPMFAWYLWGDLMPDDVIEFGRAATAEDAADAAAEAFEGTGCKFLPQVVTLQ